MSASEAALTWLGWAGLASSSIFAAALAAAAFLALAAEALSASLLSATVLAISRTSSRLKAMGLPPFCFPRMRLRRRSRALPFLVGAAALGFAGAGVGL